MPRYTKLLAGAMALLLLAFTVSRPSHAELDSREWRAFKAELKKDYESADINNKPKIIKRLVECDQPESFKLLAELYAGIARDWRSRSKRHVSMVDSLHIAAKKGEPVVAGIATKALEYARDVAGYTVMKKEMIAAAAAYDEKETVSYILKKGLTNRKSVEERLLAASYIGLTGKDDAAFSILERMKFEGDDDVAIAMARTLAELRNRHVAGELSDLLKIKKRDKRSEAVSIEIARTLGLLGAADGVDEIMKALREAEDGYFDMLVWAMSVITGEEFKTYEDWKAWFNENKAQIVDREGFIHEDNSLPSGEYNFFGLKTNAQRVIYAIGWGSSMGQTAPEALRRAVRKETGVSGNSETKQGLVVECLSAAFDAMPDGIMFNIVLFGDGVRVFSPGMAVSGSGSKAAALKFVKGVPLVGYSPLFDAIETGFALAGEELFFPQEAPLADTILLVSDAPPQSGRLNSDGEILEALEQMNDHAKITIYTVALGADAPVELLDEIAGNNNGKHNFLK